MWRSPGKSENDTPCFFVPEAFPGRLCLLFSNISGVINGKFRTLLPAGVLELIAKVEAGC